MCEISAPMTRSLGGGICASVKKAHRECVCVNECLRTYTTLRFIKIPEKEGKQNYQNIANGRV